MLYDIGIGASWDVAMRAIPSEKVEETLRLLAPQRFGYSLTTRVDASFAAEVLRNSPEPERVRLSFCNRQIDLLRDSTYEPGDICVSCNPDGKRVAVNTINIQFRDYKDNLTDRGIVWVRPGDPAEMHFVIDSPALETEGVVTKLIADAEKAVRAKLLVRFAA